MTPTWQSDDGSIRLVHGDCLRVLPELEAGSVDAVITDPPYGINWQPKPPMAPAPGLAGTPKPPGYICGRGFAPITGDDRPFDPSVFLHLGPCVFWGASYFHDALPTGDSWLVWDKKCGKWENWDIGDGELAWCSIQGAPRIFRYRWMGLVREKQERGADARYNRVRYHPNEKPIELMSWCIDRAKVAEVATVFDPYMGSGSCAIACIRTGRRFIGIEIDEAYFNIAVKRIEAELQQRRLFV